MAKIRIYAISLYYLPNFSGAAVQAHRLYSKLGKDYEVTVLTSRSELEEQTSVVEMLDGVCIKRFPIFAKDKIFNRFRGIRKIISDCRFLFRCIREILKNKNHYDFLHVHGLSGLAPLVMPVAKLFRKKSIIKLTMLGALEAKENKTLGNWLYLNLRKFALKFAENIIVMSDAMAAECINQNFSRENIIIIEQAVDTKTFSLVSRLERIALREILNIPTESFIVSFTGAVIYRKGVDILIKSFIELSQILSNMHLLIIGDRDFVEYTNQADVIAKRQYVRSLDLMLSDFCLEDRVTWTGNVLYEKVPAYIQSSDLFCFPSRLEGVPTAVLEAMSCGVPVVSSDLAGMKDHIIFDGINGYLVSDSENLSEYEKRIKSLYFDDEIRNKIGENARKTVSENFSLEKKIEDYKQIFSSLGYMKR